MTDAVAQHGRDTIQAGSKSFALASRIFSPDLRNDVAQLYAWCRFCDDAIDGQELGRGRVALARANQRAQLDQLRERTTLALAGTPDEHPVFQGLARVCEKHRLPAQHPHQLLHGFEMDVKQRSYTTVDELLDYCYHVAGVVGVMMARIMGVGDAATLDRASDLGLAFQLTNIARDLPEDAAAGRVYVPADVLRRHGAPTDAKSLSDPSHWPAAHQAVLELLDLAEQYYQSAAIGMAELPFRCAWAVNAALKVYREIGQLLRDRGPEAWQERVSTSTSRKLMLSVAALPLRTKPTTESPRPVAFYQRPGRDDA